MEEILNKQVGGDHYSQVEIQPIMYILSNKLDFCRGNIRSEERRVGKEC